MEVKIWGWSNAKKSLQSILIAKPLVGRREKKKNLKWLVLFKMLEMPPFGEISLLWV